MGSGSVLLEPCQALENTAPVAEVRLWLGQIGSYKRFSVSDAPATDLNAPPRYRPIHRARNAQPETHSDREQGRRDAYWTGCAPQAED